MGKLISALFEDSTKAGHAVAYLKGKGYTESLSIITKDEENDTPEETTVNQDISDGTVTGAVVGATAAGAAALLAGVTAIALPGSILVTGAIASALTAGAAGAVTGGLLGALVDAGIPDETANVYVESIEAGNVLVIATIENEDFDEVLKTLNDHSASEIYSTESA